MSVPVPDFVKDRVPLPFCSTPEKNVDVLSPPAVSVREPAAPLVTVPPPDNEPIVSVKLLRSYVAPVATVTALVSGMTLMAPSRKVPALILVAPL